MAKSRPKDLWRDLEPRSAGEVSGGSRRAVLRGRAGSIFPRGTVACCTFVLVGAALSGNSRRERIFTSRQAYTLEEVGRMLDGREKIPPGVPKQVVQDTFIAMNSMAERMAKKNARMARSRLKKNSLS